MLLFGDHLPGQPLRILAAKWDIAPQNVRSLAPYQPPVPNESFAQQTVAPGARARRRVVYTPKHTPKQSAKEDRELEFTVSFSVCNLAREKIPTHTL
jgi:hypothetical protein